MKWAGMYLFGFVVLLGGVLSAALLGPWAGAVVIAAVMIVQCLLFGDGGVTALGANFLNMGLIADSPVGGAPRPTGIEAGLDLTIDIVPDHWAFLGELGGIYFVSKDSHQLAATAGIQWSANEQLDFSLVALVGLLGGNDPYGLLFGVSPKLEVW